MIRSSRIRIPLVVLVKLADVAMPALNVSCHVDRTRYSALDQLGIAQICASRANLLIRRWRLRKHAGASARECVAKLLELGGGARRVALSE
jgi:hypothetical protein